MKKTYCTPEVEVCLVDFEHGFLIVSNEGKSSTNLTITNKTSDDDWSY